MAVAEEKSRSKIFLGADGNALVNLVVINAIIFAVLKFIFVVYVLSEDVNKDAFYTNVFKWFSLPSDISRLSYRPWTVISYMFVHEGVFHLLANMLWLWVFGYILQDLAGNRKLVPLYIYGGFVGALVYITSYYLIPSLQPGLHTQSMIGANAAVMAIAIATTSISPDYRIFPMINGGIPLWILTVLYVIVNFAGFAKGQPAEYIAHVAAAAFGFLFIFQMRRGNDWSLWMSNFFDWLDNLFNPNSPARKKSFKDDLFYKVNGGSPFTKTPNVTQKRIDEILDKINQQGYHFLTNEEKDILRRAAKKDDL